MIPDANRRPIADGVGMRNRFPRFLSVVIGVALGAPAFATAATITPGTFADEHGNAPDNGNCTLREAVISANEDAAEDACATGDGADVIRLAKGTYQLSVPGGDLMPGSSEVDARSGDLDLATSGSGALTIRGAAQGSIIDGGGLDRVLDVYGRTGTLRRLTLTGGGPTYNFGGALRVAEGGVVRAFDSTLSESDSVGGGSSGGGGGAYVVGGSKLTLVQSVVADNGGLHSGGLHVETDSELVIRDSIVRNNGAEEGPGGIYSGGSTLLLESSAITGNRGGSEGGGMALYSSTATIRDTRITGNLSFTDGGGVTVGHGGVVSIERSELSGNEAYDDGGGLAAGDNGVGSLELDVVNTTVSGNVADTDESGMGNGGGMILARLVHEGHIRVNSSTVADNRARIGGGILGRSGDGELAMIKASVVAGNAHLYANPVTYSGDCVGELASGGRNIFENAVLDPAACGLEAKPSDMLGVDPLIGALAPNGGPTSTHLLRKGSPAINAGGAAGAPRTDQRGVPRSQPDVGAYERAKCAGVLVNVVGTGGADRLRGTNGHDGILGLGGKDVIRVRGGNDGVCAGAGGDRVSGAGGRDRLNGDAGGDVLSGGADRDRCTGGAGRDIARRSCELISGVP